MSNRKWGTNARSGNWFYTNRHVTEKTKYEKIQKKQIFCHGAVSVPHVHYSSKVKEGKLVAVPRFVHRPASKKAVVPKSQRATHKDFEFEEITAKEQESRFNEICAALRKRKSENNLTKESKKHGWGTSSSSMAG